MKRASWMKSDSRSVALLFLGLAMILAAAPSTAMVSLDSEGRGHVIGNCKDLSIKEGHNYISTRKYLLTGKCELKTHDSQNYETAEIEATFYKSSNKAKETISLPGFGGPFELIMQCDEDPWLVSWAACSKISFNKASYRYALELMHDKYDQAAYPLPLTRAGQPAVQSYLQQILQPLPPSISSPFKDKSYSFPGDQDLVVDVDYAGVLEKAGANGWYELFTYPSGADKVELEWQSLRRAPGLGGGANQTVKIWLPVQVVAEVQVNLPFPRDLQTLDEGRYRVRARHKLPAWPWSAWREFWVGDPVDESKPGVTIARPEKDAAIGAGSTESLIPVDIQIKYWQPQGNVPPPPTVQRKQVEFELGYFFPSLPDSNPDSVKSGWGPDTDKLAYQRDEWEIFTLYIHSAVWRIRARLRVDDSQEEKAPWTAWRHFIVGSPDLRLFPAGDSAGAQAAGGFAKKTQPSASDGAGQALLSGRAGFGAKAALVKTTPSGSVTDRDAAKHAASSGLADPPDPGKLKTRGATTPRSGAAAGVAAAINPRSVPAESPQESAQDTQAAISTPASAQLRVAKLSVKSVALTPSPLVAGATITMGVTLRNSGAGESRPTDSFTVSCKDTAGARPCPVPDGTFAIGKAVPPGGETSLVLVATQPAEAGEYRLSIAVPPDQAERPWSMTVKVPAATRSQDKVNLGHPAEAEAAPAVPRGTPRLRQP